MTVPDILDEVAGRIEQLRALGALDDLTDGTGPRRPVFEQPAKVRVGQVRAENNFRMIRGMPRWAALLLESVVEAYAADDRTELRRAVLNTAALAVAWTDAIDSRDGDNPDDADDVQEAAA